MKKEQGNQVNMIDSDDGQQNVTVKIPAERLQFLDRNYEHDSKLSLSTVIAINENMSPMNQ